MSSRHICDPGHNDIWGAPVHDPDQHEREEIDRELISLMFTSIPSIAILAFAMGIVGAVLSFGHGDGIGGLIGAAGLVVGAARVVLARRYGAALEKQMTFADARRWEMAYGMAGVCFCVAVGGLAAWTFLTHAGPVTLMAAVLLFAYPTGMIVRVAVRPNIARVQLAVCLSIPVMACLASGTWEMVVLAVLIIVYGLAGMEMIVYLYNSTHERLLARHRLSHQARHDPLTRLPNRTHYAESLDLALASLSPSSKLALHYVDLDGFKTVNDTHGHAVGDMVLIEAADAIRGAIGKHDLAARLGGDEFAIVQTKIDCSKDVETLADRLVKAIGRRLETLPGQATASVGAALACVEAPDRDRLMLEADAALYAAKALGKARFVAHWRTASEENALQQAV